MSKFYFFTDSDIDTIDLQERNAFGSFSSPAHGYGIYHGIDILLTKEVGSVRRHTRGFAA